MKKDLERIEEKINKLEKLVISAIPPDILKYIDFLEAQKDALYKKVFEKERRFEERLYNEIYNFIEARYFMGNQIGLDCFSKDKKAMYLDHWQYLASEIVKMIMIRLRELEREI